MKILKNNVCMFYKRVMKRMSKKKNIRSKSRSGSGKPDRKPPSVTSSNIKRLKKENVRLTKENYQLKTENSDLKKTLSQINSALKENKPKKVKVSPLESPDKLALEGVSPYNPLSGMD